jgi:sugar (pentulose or hexulose) kinase
VGTGARNAAWTRIRRRVLGVDLMAAKSEDAAVGVATLALKAMR